MSDERKEERKEESLKRRLTRRTLRREHRIETIIPEDRFTNTSDFVSAILTGEIIAERIMGYGALDKVVREREPRLFDDKFGLLDRPVRERQITPSTRIDTARSKITDETSYIVRDYHLVIDSDNRGVCSEIALRSPSSAFSLSVTIDGVKQFDRTYDEFAILSPETKLIDAFVETHGDALYVLAIAELSWRKSCQAIIRVTENITFANIFVNMKEYVI